MIATLQRKLVLNDAALCVLLDVHGVRRELPGHDEDDALALALDGFLPWTFDISLGQKRDLRFFPPAVEHFRKTGGGRAFDWDFDRVFKSIVGGEDKPWLPGTRVKLILNCSSTHVISLIEARLLKVLPGTDWQTGPNGSPQITAASLREFLFKRRLA